MGRGGLCCYSGKNEGYLILNSVKTLVEIFIII
jgi:hypothetical protein